MKPIVSLLGPKGSFSDSALPKGFHKQYRASINNVFRDVRRGYLGFLPVQNKLVGAIPSVSKKLSEYTIHKRIKIKVSFMLLAKNKILKPQIRFIFCPKIARNQCRKFCKKSLKSAKFFTNFDSTSAAIKKIVQLKGKKAFVSAAIGSENAAKIYGLKIIARNIQDTKNNWTEFVLFKDMRFFGMSLVFE